MSHNLCLFIPFGIKWTRKKKRQNIAYLSQSLVAWWRNDLKLQTNLPPLSPNQGALHSQHLGPLLLCKSKIRLFDEPNSRRSLWLATVTNMSNLVTKLSVIPIMEGYWGCKSISHRTFCTRS